MYLASLFFSFLHLPSCQSSDKNTHIKATHLRQTSIQTCRNNKHTLLSSLLFLSLSCGTNSLNRSQHCFNINTKHSYNQGCVHNGQQWLRYSPYSTTTLSHHPLQIHFNQHPAHVAPKIQTWAHPCTIYAKLELRKSSQCILPPKSLYYRKSEKYLGYQKASTVHCIYISCILVVRR